MIVQELYQIQHEHGYLPEDQLRALSQRIGKPLHRLHEVATFFPHYRLQPPPAVEVKVCCDMACHLAGGENLRKHLEESGKQASSQISVKRVSCLGRCDHAPAISVNDHVYGNKSPAEIDYLMQCAMARQSLPNQAASTPATKWQIDPYDAADRDGSARYAAVRDWANGWKADRDANLDAKRNRIGDGILKTIKDAGLRGMGGAMQPTVDKWEAVRGAPGSPKYVVCNGDESEPGTFKDRDLLLFVPHLLVEGVVIAGLVCGAERGYIYIRHEYQQQIEAIRAEIERAKQLGFCGDDVLGTGVSFPVEVYVSPGGYICGEESALIEVIEDRRGEPRNKPPMMVFEGLFGKPTVVNNVETLCWVPGLLSKGSKWYAGQGANSGSGLHYISISGHVTRPGVYEVPFGLTLRELVCGMAGGISGRRKLKAVATSGPSGGFLPAVLDLTKEPKSFVDGLRKRNLVAADATQFDILDIALDAELFKPFPNFMLGAGIIIYGDDADMLLEALNCVEFYRNESCGKCVPCRVGTQKMVLMIEDLLAGRVQHRLEATLEELAQTMLEASICGLGRVAANPLTTALRYFHSDIEKHLRS